MIEKTKLDSEESIISLNVNYLRTNVPLKDAIDIVLKKLYSQNKPPDLSRSTIKRLLYMAVILVMFILSAMTHGIYRTAQDGLAMGDPWQSFRKTFG